jgi:two-component system chemotaxis response regulator CheB
MTSNDDLFSYPSSHYRNFRAIVIGVSAGGQEALSHLFSCLTESFPLPIVIVQHLHHTQDGSYARLFDERCALKVKEADEKEPVQVGHVYFAPPNYHLLVERDETFSLSVDEKVKFSRPSIDVMFESAARAWSFRLIGIILTGASDDGTNGLHRIKECGGTTIAQDPASARYPVMPLAAIKGGCIDRVMSLDAIANFLRAMVPTPLSVVGVT